MDGQRFDRLVRTLATTSSRRRVLGVLAGSLTAGLRWQRGAGAAACREAGRLCTKDANCCSPATCDPTTRTCVCPPGTENCRGACKTTTDYKTDILNCGRCGNRCPIDQCNRATCANGVCGLEPNPARIGQACDDGDRCTTGDMCQEGDCVGNPITCPTCQRCGNGDCVADESQNDTECGTDQICCNGTCISALDSQNCGACGNVCPTSLPNATVTCGHVTATDDLEIATIGCLYFCARDYSNCDGNIATGCETLVTDDPNNCGSCNFTCPSDHYCCGCTCFPNSSPGLCSICPGIRPGRLIR